jgi:type IV pilus assembly protein PilB
MSADGVLFRAKGCDACRGMGYKGRVGIFEVIRITNTLRDMIQSRASLADIQAQADREGMYSLVTNGLEKVRQGVTSLEELVKSVVEGGH